MLKCTVCEGKGFWIESDGHGCIEKVPCEICDGKGEVEYAMGRAFAVGEAATEVKSYGHLQEPDDSDQYEDDSRYEDARHDNYVTRDPYGY